MVLFAGHDNSAFGLMTALGQPIPKRWPWFASHFEFELWRVRGSGKMKVIRKLPYPHERLTVSPFLMTSGGGQLLQSNLRPEPNQACGNYTGNNGTGPCDGQGITRSAHRGASRGAKTARRTGRPAWIQYSLAATGCMMQHAIGSLCVKHIYRVSVPGVCAPIFGPASIWFSDALN